MPETRNRNTTRPGWSLDKRDPRFIESMLPVWEWLYKNYFRVQASGWENIPSQEKILLVGSHSGGLAAPDMMMMMYDWFSRFGTERPVYGLMHPKAWIVDNLVSQLAAKSGAIIAHPKMARAALRSGASVLVYPGGAQDVFRPHRMRNQIYFAGRKGFIKLALRENVPIVPVISVGAHDTLIVLADLYPILKQIHDWGVPWLGGFDPEVFPVYLGLPWGLALGPLPNIPFPVKIYTRTCPAIKFAEYGEAAASDRAYVDECYNLVLETMQREMDELVAIAADH